MLLTVFCVSSGIEIELQRRDIADQQKLLNILGKVLSHFWPEIS